MNAYHLPSDSTLTSTICGAPYDSADHEFICATCLDLECACPCTPTCG